MLVKKLFLLGIAIAGFCCCTKTTITLQNTSVHDAQDVWVGKINEKGDWDSVGFGSILAGETDTTKESDVFGQSILRFTLPDTVLSFDIDIAQYNDNCFSFSENGIGDCPADSTP